MRFSKACKALFLIVNHVAAYHVPRDFIAARIQGQNDMEDDGELETQKSAIRSSSPLIVPRAAAPVCDKCRKRCSPGRIIDPKDCTECIKCPKGQMPNKSQKACIPTPEEKKKQDEEKKKQDEEKKKKEEEEKKKKKEKEDKERRFKDKIPEKRKEYKAKRYEVKRKDKTRIYHDKRDELKRRKVRRMSRCLALVPLAMGASVASDYADEFFDEEYLEDMNLLEFWPKNTDVDGFTDDTSDAIFEDDDYVNKWIAIGEKIGARDVYGNITELELSEPESEPESIPVTVAPLPVRDVTEPETTTALTVREEFHQLHARCPICFLIPIFAAVLRTAAAAARVAATAIRLSKNTIKFAKGRGSKVTRVEQRKGAEKISKDKNWRNCLVKLDPF
ncbi:hypothetical protein F5Y13DRAFT_204457 [Hypoxylon sp. FL1857]|nr:hypothetical protein F5Y13DRAFT_204457 [Hypoxylon sp. FL1857]